MQYLYSWVCEFFPKDPPSLEKTLEALDNLGLSVTGTTHFKPAFSGVVVGEVLEVSKHPNADRLSLTKVTDGAARFDVVCGAPNVKAGQRIALARVGAALESPEKGRLVIKKTAIRGASSEGMICSSLELGLDQEHEGILVLPQDWVLGKPLEQYIGEDAVFDLELPFHRWDLTSHLGLARELSIYWWRERVKPLEHGLEAVPINPEGVKNKPDAGIVPEARSACRRYMGALIHGVKIQKSPLWMERRLKMLGIKSINNVVDVTNYVLLETGQPLHAFDWARVEGRKISVRPAKEGEKFAALDGTSHALVPGDLVIADASKPLALAGVIGGEESKVTDETEDIFLECAWFSRSSVRRTARRLGLRTDSSQRFEKETDVVSLPQVFNRACYLLAQTAGGRLADRIDLYPEQAAPVGVDFNAEEARSLLGYPADTEEMFRILRPMCEGIQKQNSDSWRCTVASWRSDLKIPEDFAEEILRHAGTDRVPGARTHPARVSLPGTRPAANTAREAAQETGAWLREFFSGLGFSEAVNYPLVGTEETEKLLGPSFVQKAVQVANPVSADLNMLRPGLFIGLYRSWERNFFRGHRFIRLQETGDVFNQDHLQGRPYWAAVAFGPMQRIPYWQNKEEAFFGFWAMRGALESAFRRLGLKPEARPATGHARAFHPNRQIEFYSGGFRIGFVTEIATRDMLEASPQHPAAYAKADLAALSQCLSKLPAKRYKPMASLGRIHRDLSFNVSKEISWGKMESLVRESLGNFLEAVFPFDVYDKDAKEKTKSVAFRMVLSQGERSLNQEEIQGLVQKVCEALENEVGAKLRGA